MPEEPKVQPKEKPVCPVCKSDDVVVDAVARWDEDTQDWSLSATYDDKTCDACGYSGSNFDWIEIDDEGSTNSGTP